MAYSNWANCHCLLNFKENIIRNQTPRISCDWGFADNLNSFINYCSFFCRQLSCLLGFLFVKLLFIFMLLKNCFNIGILVDFMLRNQLIQVHNFDVVPNVDLVHHFSPLHQQHLLECFVIGRSDSVHFRLEVPINFKLEQSNLFHFLSREGGRRTLQLLRHRSFMILKLHQTSFIVLESGNHRLKLFRCVS